MPEISQVPNISNNGGLIEKLRSSTFSSLGVGNQGNQGNIGNIGESGLFGQLKQFFAQSIATGLATEDKQEIADLRGRGYSLERISRAIETKYSDNEIARDEALALLGGEAGEQIATRIAAKRTLSETLGKLPEYASKLSAGTAGIVHRLATAPIRAIGTSLLSAKEALTREPETADIPGVGRIESYGAQQRKMQEELKNNKYYQSLDPVAKLGYQLSTYAIPATSIIGDWLTTSLIARGLGSLLPKTKQIPRPQVATPKKEVKILPSGQQSPDTKIYYHVRTKEDAELLMVKKYDPKLVAQSKFGTAGGKEMGEGIYGFDNINNAKEYAQSIKDPVIMRFEVPNKVVAQLKIAPSVDKLATQAALKYPEEFGQDAYGAVTKYVREVIRAPGMIGATNDPYSGTIFYNPHDVRFLPPTLQEEFPQIFK